MSRANVELWLSTSAGNMHWQKAPDRGSVYRLRAVTHSTVDISVVCLCMLRTITCWFALQYIVYACYARQRVGVLLVAASQLCAVLAGLGRELGFLPIEVNASDTRNKADSQATMKAGINGKLANSIKELATNTTIGIGGRPSQVLPMTNPLV